MLRFEWGDSLHKDPEVSDLLKSAATFDSEQGFSTTAPPLGVIDPPAVVTTRELIARMSQDVGSVVRHPRQLVVAFLRLAVDETGTGTVELTVHPDYRSLGIATLLVEKLGLDTASDDGWLGTGAKCLQIWARGSHPAADRMAMRFDAGTARVLYRLIRPLLRRNPVPAAGAIPDVQVKSMRNDDAADIAALARTALHSVEPATVADVLVAREGTARIAGFVEVAKMPLDGHADRWLGAVRTLVVDPSANRTSVTRALLGEALRHLFQAGLGEVEILVEAIGDDLLRHCRAVGFHHDQTDVCYQVPIDQPPFNL